MQQTETYQLNLIETSDTFSPAPLNENMEKVEGALSAIHTQAAAWNSLEAQMRADADEALDQRLTTLENHHFVTGFAAPGSLVEWLGATPKALIVYSPSGGTVIVIEGHNQTYLKIVEGGFEHSDHWAGCFYVAFF